MLRAFVRSFQARQVGEKNINSIVAGVNTGPKRGIQIAAVICRMVKGGLWDQKADKTKYADYPYDLIIVRDRKFSGLRFIDDRSRHNNSEE